MKQRNKCVNLRKKAVKKYFKKVTESGIVENKQFWKTIKPFITNKGGMNSDDIMILNSDNRLITDEKKLATMLNNHYINIVEKSIGLKPTVIDFSKTEDRYGVIDNIIERFKDHPSIMKINEFCPFNDTKFNFKEMNEKEIEKLFSGVNCKASAGEDKIPPKLAKLASSSLIKPLTKAVNSSIRNNTFPHSAK